MGAAATYRNLPILLAMIRQESGTGELVLEQSDGVRRFRFDAGHLVALRSDAVGEQLGGRLLREGILDLPELNRLLADDARCRIGEKVVQRGLMGIAERNGHLQALQEQVMVHALEHPILRWSWIDMTVGHDHDPEFRLQDRHLIWKALQDSREWQELVAILESENGWKWQGRLDLLDSLDDMPLTPGTAFAVSFFGADPIGFETFRFLSGLGKEEAGRLIATLWAFGGLALTEGTLPSLRAAAPPSEPAAPDLPLIPPPPDSPFGPPKQVEKTARLQVLGDPEFLDPEPDPLGDPDSEWARRVESLVDAPPCGPRAKPGLPAWLTEAPESRQPDPTPHHLPPGQTPWPEDLPPCGPKPKLPEGMDAWPEDLPPCGPRPAAAQPIPGPSPRATNPPGTPLPSPWATNPPGTPLPSPRATNPPGTPLPLPLAPAVPAERPQQFAFPSTSASIELDPERKGIPPPPTAEALAAQARAGRLLAQAKRQAQMGRTVEAVRTLEEAVDLLPEGDAGYEAWMMLGQLRKNNTSWMVRAIHAFQAAALLRPKEVEPLLAMAELLRRTGADADAEACCRRIRELDPYVRIPGQPSPGRPK